MAKKKPPVEHPLEWTPRNCWEVYTSRKDRAAMDKLAATYMDFLSRCKTERETVDYVLAAVNAHGFAPSTTGPQVVRALYGKTVLLARRGRKPMAQGVRLLGAHADTPRLDLKQHPLYEECHIALGKTHYYGGIRKHQWLARPLALHGVVARTDGTVVPVVLGEAADDPVFTIADLLPHLAQKQAEQKLSEAFEGEKLSLVLGHAPADKAEGQDQGKRVRRRVLELLFARYAIREADLYSAELQAVPAGPARYVGLDKALIGGYGHDDRACVFAGLTALLQAKTPEHTQVVIFWDKEEIGSEGATGAKSQFLEYVLLDLLAAWEPKTRLLDCLFATKAISADVHAAMDPDFQELHDRLNAAFIGHGPCFCKFTGHRGKYEASEATAEYVAWLRNLLDRAGVPWQMAELGKVDHGGGGTVAKHLAEYGMSIIDCGPPILSMHSPFELASVADLYATVQAYTAFLRS